MASKFSDQIRRAINECGVSRYRIAKDIGTSQATLSRFMAGERGLTMKLMDTLADYLGLSVVVKERKGR